MLSSVVWCFQLTGGVSCTHQPCIFWYCIHLLNTPLYIYIHCCSKLLAVLLAFFVTERSLMATVKEFVMQSDHSASVFVCVTFVCNRNKSNNNMNGNWRDCTNGLLSVEADTLIQGISETVPVLAWGVQGGWGGQGKRRGKKTGTGKIIGTSFQNAVRIITSFPCETLIERAEQRMTDRGTWWYIALSIESIALSVGQCRGLILPATVVPAVGR